MRKLDAVLWTGRNLEEVIEFTGKYSKFNDWFKSWEEYKKFIHEHGNIVKLFAPDGLSVDVLPGTWIVKMPEGFNVPMTNPWLKANKPEPQGLDKAIKDYFQGLWPGTETAEQCNTDMHFTPPAIMRLAEHFYSLGKESKVSIEGLDEAAEEYRKNDDAKYPCDQCLVNTFKAGAKWMAEQYKTLGETEIYLEDDGEEPPYTQEWLDLDTTEFKIPDGFKAGDKVIVQIRKIN